MHLLIVSHSCCTQINQQIYKQIQKLTGWEIDLMVPDKWQDEFGNQLDTQLWPGLKAKLIKLPVLLNGRIVTHTYRTSLKKILAASKPDVVYINHEPYAVATWQVARACKQLGIPFGIYSCQNIAKRYPIPFRWMERYVYKHTAYAFPITEAVADVMQAKGCQAPCPVVPLPLDPELYRPNAELETPHPLKEHTSSFLIGYVGRIIEAKGLRTLALALRELKDYDWKVVLIGKGEFLPTFKALLAEDQLEDRIIELGYVPHQETPRYLAAMDTLVLPSETQANWKEQFGRVIPEAMACGTPVIGSDSGEIPNLIRKSQGGLVFPERDVNALAEAFKQLISDTTLTQQLGERGREWTHREVALNGVAHKMIATLKQYEKQK